MLVRNRGQLPFAQPADFAVNVIWYVLYAIVALASASIGCHAGLTGTSRPLVVTAFVLIISVVMVLITDLDSPRRGALRVSQQVLVDLRRTMNGP